tara:strand:+ start:2818 stop:4482 length:1665 start_codon:yes stop_codon:yes gene_type:complete
MTYLVGLKTLQGQFEPVESTGLPYHVIISQALIDGDPLPAGSQIGVFDGELCVGASFLEFEGQENIDIVTWEGSYIGDDILAGFESGNPIGIKIWAILYDTELIMEAESAFEVGSGNFGNGSYSVTSITALSGFFSDILINSDIPMSFSVQIGNSIESQFTLTNTGNIPLEIFSVSATSSNFIIGEYNSIISMDELVSIPIIFSPSDTGLVNSEFQIESNDFDNPILSIPLEGLGLLPNIDIIQNLPDFEMEEDDGPDTMFINLGDHFSDSYSELSFISESGNYDFLEVEFIDEVGLVFHPSQDWFGDVDIYIQASNGDYITADTMNVSVLGINDAPNPFNIISLDSILISHADQDTIAFNWEPSFDVDSDMLLYQFQGELLIEDSINNEYQYLFASLTDSTRHVVSFSQLVSNVVSSNISQASIIWTVFAHDGEDTTFASNGPNDFAVILNYLDTRADLYPDDFILLQNYPNPFNSATVISYVLPYEVKVGFDIMDVNGRNIISFPTEIKSAGHNYLRWDGQDKQGKSVSNGIYFFRMSTENFISQKKMLLVK